MPSIIVTPSLSPSGANEMIGRGVVMVDPLDPVTLLRSMSLRHVGNVEKLEIDDKVEVKEKYESMDPNGLLYARAVTRQTVTLKLTGDEITADNVAAAFNGVLSTITGAGGSPAGETIMSAAGLVPGRYYQLANKNVDPATVAIGGLVLGTDFVVTDALNGVIYFPPTGAGVAGTVYTASYTYAAFTMPKVNLAAVPSLDCYCAFYGAPVKGRVFFHEYWHVQFTPTGKLEWISDNFASFELEGLVLADTVNHPTEPIGRIVQVA
jgi:hypothetical protein